jgi:fatty acid-binding protein DegV
VIGNTYAELAGAGYDAIVSVHLSSKISGTVDAAQAAAASVDIPIIVVDSMSVGDGSRVCGVDRGCGGALRVLAAQ